MNENIIDLNNKLKNKRPDEIVRWALNQYENPILTTNFRPYECTILHLCSTIIPEIKVVWCDSGYNTKATYKYAENIIKRFNLNIHIYVPKLTKEFRDIIMGGIPNINDPIHKEFTEQVKLEPFRRAMEELSPNLWITNLRKGQTNFRDTIDVISQTKNGLIKACPFYYWSDKDLDNYLKEYSLENEYDYFDPTKVEEKRECGLHGE